MPDATAGNPIGNTVSGDELAITSEAQGDVLIRNASGWVRLAAGTSGYFLKTLGAGADAAWAANTSSLQLVSNVDTSAGDATSYTISSLDLDTDGYYILIISMKYVAAVTGTLALEMSGDTTATNYYTQRLDHDATTIASERNANNIFSYGLPQNEGWHCVMHIMRGPTGLAFAFGQGTGEHTGTYTTHNWQFTTNHKTAGNVTSLTIKASQASAIAQNSKITLYKITRA